MLIANTNRAIVQEGLDKLNVVSAHRLEIAKFMELCAVLRQQGSAFAESLQAGHNEIIYTITPKNHGDYLAIVEALAAMGAHRLHAEAISTYTTSDLINPQPDAPAFFLNIPFNN